MKKNIVCIGQTVLDVQIAGVELKQDYMKEVRRADKVQLSVGGDATNQSIVLRRLGFNTKLVGGVGNDAAGFFLKATIESKGVNLDDYVVVENESSFVSIILIDKQGERSFIFSGSPGTDQLEPNLAAIEGMDVVSIGSMFGSPVSTPEGIERIVKPAKENGSLVCADLIVMPGGYTVDDIGNTLSYIDYVFPNEDEARLFTGKETLDEIADAFLKYGVQNVVIKRGKDGCFVKNAKERLMVPAYHVNAVDTTGAGDNFVSGFITSVLDGKSLYDCCKFGSATAAVNIQKMGANTGVESIEQINEFIANNKFDGDK